jgi:hypothetical protein
MNIDLIYFLIDEYLKQTFHQEDKQSLMSDSEIIFAYVISFNFFSGNYCKTLCFLKQTNLMKYVLSKSRFSRRIKSLEWKIQEIFTFFSQNFKDTKEKEFCIDTFPLSICKLVRMRRCKLVKGREYLGYNSSKEEYYYGFKVHLIASRQGGVIEFDLSPAHLSDLTGFKLLNFDLPDNSEIFADKIYCTYTEEDLLMESSGIKLSSIRKRNSKKTDNTYMINHYKSRKRKIIENIISKIQGLFPKKIHCTNLHGLFIKIFGFILAYNFSIFSL